MECPPAMFEDALRVERPLGAYLLVFAFLASIALWHENMVLGKPGTLGGAPESGAPKGECVMWQPAPEPTIFDW